MKKIIELKVGDPIYHITSGRLELLEGEIFRVKQDEKELVIHYKLLDCLSEYITIPNDKIDAYEYESMVEDVFNTDIIIVGSDQNIMDSMIRIVDEKLNKLKDENNNRKCSKK